MADEMDRAAAREAEILSDALAVQSRRAAAAPKVAGLGYCLNARCAEDFGGDMQRLFCGADCADAYRRQSRN